MGSVKELFNIRLDNNDPECWKIQNKIKWRVTERVEPETIPYEPEEWEVGNLQKILHSNGKKHGMNKKVIRKALKETNGDFIDAYELLTGSRMPRYSRERAIQARLHKEQKTKQLRLF